MKRKIFFSMIFTVAAALIAVVFLCFFVYHSFFEAQVKSDIRAQAILMKSGYEQATDEQLFLDTVGGFEKNLRVSLIEPDGNVCFDTYADANDLYDHLDRPEIAGAFELGSGEAVRYSKTLDKDTYYYALLLSDGNVVRVAAPVSTIGAVFASALPLLILLLCLLLVICLFLSKLLTNRIVRPLETLGDNLDNLSESDNYDELNPFVEKIARQNADIQRQLKKRKEERDTITLITDNMQEGLVMLGQNRYILSVNRAAIGFLNRHSDLDFVGQNLIVLTREAALLAACDKALLGESVSGVFSSSPPLQGDIPKQAYQYFANPVYADKAQSSEITGAILLLFNVTEQQKAEKIRREFSANVSHELKTPLTTISGFAEMIQNDMVNNHDDLLRFGALIKNESGRLLALIDDIMQIARLEENGQTIGQRRESVAVDSIAAEVCESLTPKALKRGVQVKKELTPCVVIGNRAVLREIVFNLIDNAIKYNVKAGTVRVKVEKLDNHCKITVEDTGIGIEHVHHDRLFERFYRVDKSRSKLTGGTGLGLSIVKHAVEMHSGTIALESEPFKGTKITVILPI